MNLAIPPGMDGKDFTYTDSVPEKWKKWEMCYGETCETTRLHKSTESPSSA